MFSVPNPSFTESACVVAACLLFIAVVVWVVRQGAKGADPDDKEPW